MHLDVFFKIFKYILKVIDPPLTTWTFLHALEHRNKLHFYFYFYFFSIKMGIHGQKQLKNHGLY